MKRHLEDMMDKRSESQFNQDPYEGGEDPWYSWNPENMPDEMPKAVKQNKTMPLSRNGEDIENSKRSRGEQL